MAQLVPETENGPPEPKPQANIYTVLVFVAIVALGVTVGFVLYNLLMPLSDGGYGLKFGDLFDAPKAPVPPKLSLW
jgi:hypothetical protein